MYHLFIVLILLSSLASAESAGKRTCRILFLGGSDTAPDTLYLFDGVGSQNVELPTMNLSPVYQLSPGPKTLRMLPAAPAKPEEISPDAPSVQVAEAVSDLYLLVTSDPANKIAPVRMQVVDVDPSKFKNGQMLWFNLSSNGVGGEVGTKRLAMEANSRSMMDAPAKKREDYPVKLYYRIEGKPDPYPLCETKWLHHPDSRGVFFVVAQKGSRIPRVIGFRDFRAPAEKSSTAP